MKKIKVVHIHTDRKFLFDTKNFEGNYFDNIIIFIGQEANRESLDKHIFFVEKAVNKIPEILKLCQSTDMVVLYDLDSFKQRLVLKFPDTVKIAWRFFGYELYAKRPDLYKSKLSRKYDKVPLKKNMKKNLYPMYSLLTDRATPSQKFNRTIQRIDFFLVLSEEEYKALKVFWPKLPKFIKLPHFLFNREQLNVDYNKKEQDKPIVILGNNRSAYNNHLDLIDLIEKYENKQNYAFTLFFNYGQHQNYAQEVLKRVQDKKHYTLVNTFLEKEEFMGYYQRATALVINGYRQMAGANIRIALECGLKLYLNEKNVEKKFLEKEGFIVHSIQDFEQDLQTNNIRLNKEEAMCNTQNYTRFKNNYTKEDFQKKIFKNLAR